MTDTSLAELQARYGWSDATLLSKVVAYVEYIERADGPGGPTGLLRHLELAEEVERQSKG